MLYLGIDPGFSDAAVVIISDPQTVVYHKKFHVQDNPAALTGKLDEIGHKVALATMEVVHAMPQDGRVSAFKFGWGAGWLAGVIAGYGITSQGVTPWKWQNWVAKTTGGKLPKNKRQRKKVLQELALNCGVELPLACVDAYWIARWGAENWRGS